MLCVALTGGIGSGKTTVANYFAKLGIAVIDADIIARDVTAPGTPGYQAIVKHFGQTILSTHGELDRKKLRQIVFSDPAAKEWLENTLHPLILQAMREQIHNVQSAYCLLVIPLLAETRLPIDFIDRVLVVDAPVASRKEWAAQRDNVQQAQIEAIMASQSSAAQRLALADDIITNIRDLAFLEDQVNKLHQRYLQLASL